MEWMQPEPVAEEEPAWLSAEEPAEDAADEPADWLSHDEVPAAEDDPYAPLVAEEDPYAALVTDEPADEPPYADPYAEAWDSEDTAIPAWEPVAVEPEPEVAFEPEPEPEPVAFEPEPELAGAVRETAATIAMAPAPAVDEPEPAPDEADPARTGRFALGGFATQPGQQALGGVTFRDELADASAAAIELRLDGAINCDEDGLEVVTEPGFAPTSQGFTVRVSALAAGPFAASGTFRVR
jgi:hypothetical protein